MVDLGAQRDNGFISCRLVDVVDVQVITELSRLAANRCLYTALFEEFANVFASTRDLDGSQFYQVEERIAREIGDGVRNGAIAAYALGESHEMDDSNFHVVMNRCVQQSVSPLVAHFEDNLTSGVALFELGHCRLEIFERIHGVDDRFDVTGFDEIADLA